MFGRKKIAMLVAEFLGTGVLSLVFLSVQRSTIGIAYFVALAAGLAVAGLTYVFTNISGAHFNPAITLGLWSARKIKTVPAVMYIVAQLLGGWAAYGLYTYFINNTVQKIGTHFTVRVMVAEAVGTLIFALVWAAVSAQRLAAASVGAGMSLGIVVASGASYGLLNPAIALATRAWPIWGSLGWGTYVLGPVVGSVLAFNLYQLIFGDSQFVGAAPAGTPPVVIATEIEEVEVTVPLRDKAGKATAARTTRTKTTTRTAKKRK